MTYQIDGETYLIKIEKKKNRNTYIRIKEDMTIYVTTHYLVSEKEILNIIEKYEKAIKKGGRTYEEKDSKEFRNCNDSCFACGRLWSS